jgi:hypothetical protein
MAENHNINQLRHFLAPNYTAHTDIRLRDDLVFDVPPIGFFKIAHTHAKEPRARILYFARSPGDFDLGADAGNPIKGNEHIYPVCIERVPYKENARWDNSNRLGQHDVTWALAEIMRIVEVLPDVLFHEANLHRLSETAYHSAYINYRSVPDDQAPDLTRIMISTNTTRGFEPTGIKTSPKLEDKKGIAHLFRTIGRQILRHMPSSSFPLGLRDQSQNGQTVIRKIFAKKAVIPAIKGDYVYRMSQVWHGVDPVTWRENRFMPAVRLHEKLRAHIEDMRNVFHDDKRRTFVQVGLMLTHVAVDGVFSTIGGFLLDRLAEASIHEKSSRVDEKWGAVIRDDTHMLSINTHLNQILLKIRPDVFFDPKYFADIAWLDRNSHCYNIPADEPAADPAIASGFSTWLRGQFFAPYVGLFEYLGERGKNINLADTASIKGIRLNVPNGLQIYYVPESRTLYAYYHRLKLQVKPENGALAQQRLPPGSEEWFKAGKVLKVNLSEGARGTIISVDFTVFATHIHKTLGGKEGEPPVMLLLRPHDYIPELSSARPAPSSAPAQRSPILAA